MAPDSTLIDRVFPETTAFQRHPAGRVDAAFFAGTTVKSNFICGLGHGDASKVFPRSPRLAFDEACSFA